MLEDLRTGGGVLLTGVVLLSVVLLVVNAVKYKYIFFGEIRGKCQFDKRYGNSQNSV